MSTEHGDAARRPDPLTPLSDSNRASVCERRTELRRSPGSMYYIAGVRSSWCVCYWPRTPGHIYLPGQCAFCVCKCKGGLCLYAQQGQGRAYSRRPPSRGRAPGPTGPSGPLRCWGHEAVVRVFFFFFSFCLGACYISRGHTQNPPSRRSAPAPTQRTAGNPTPKPTDADSTRRSFPAASVFVLRLAPRDPRPGHIHTPR
jgi:hypothetical protein